MKKPIMFMDNKKIKLWAAISLALTLSGCVTDSVNRAPASPSTPWQPDPQTRQAVVSSFALAENDQILAAPPSAEIQSGHEYQLAGLIDIAQMQNPDTRLAWQQARQAALGVGLAESVFLPIITASVVGGYQHTRTPLPYEIGDQRNLRTHSHEVVPALMMQWLLFDFGQRRALLKAAEQISFASNIGFNGVHQKIIFDVTRTYYQYGAAQSRRQNTEQMLRNSRQILDAAESRRKQGVATIVEVAQAKQLVAQAEMNWVVAGNVERDAKQALFASLGIPANTVLKVGFPAYQSPSIPVSAPTPKMIEQALARRPDVQASYALAQAAKEGVSAAEADYLPKIYVAGALASGHGQFDIQGLPAIGQQTSSSSILLGVTLPLYDGGMRAIRVKEAESRAASAHETFKKTRDTAAREIVVAADALQSATAANKASINLVKTAMVTYDAAFDAYKHGVGTITVANEAANNLLAAQQVDIDARTSVLVTAANLAFVMGEMTQAPLP